MLHKLELCSKVSLQRWLVIKPEALDLGELQLY